MEGGPADHHSADIHRSEMCDRGDDTGPSDRMLDIDDSRADMHGGEFVSDGVPRMMLGGSEGFPEREAINLNDQAIGIEWEIRPLSRKVLNLHDNLIDVCSMEEIGGGVKSPLAQEPDLIRIGIDATSSYCTASFGIREAVGEEFEIPLSSDHVVELP